MFIENSRGYTLWIIPFINLPTSPFGAMEISVINFRVSQEFPQRLPVDCGAGVYLLAAPMSLRFKTPWQFVKRFAYRLTLVSLSPIANNVFLKDWSLFLTATGTFLTFWPLPPLDRSASQLEWETDSHGSQLKEKWSPASGTENEPALPSERNKLGEGKAAFKTVKRWLIGEILVSRFAYPIH